MTTKVILLIISAARPKKMFFYASQMQKFVKFELCQPLAKLFMIKY
jgi:hypothetical protein